MRTFLYIISAVFTLNTIILIGRRSFTLGLAIMVGLSVTAFFTARYFDFIYRLTQDGPGLYFRFFILFGIACFIFLAAYVLSFARTTVTYNEDAIIVLGCGLNSDGTPSHTLVNRLDGCVKYHSKNPDSYIVVTGGLSRFGNQTEGMSMKKYLTDKGVSADKILVDEKATNTKENFEYSLQLLETAGIGKDNIAFVTNSFHIFRGGQYAKQAGFEKITALSVKTDRAVFMPAVIREVCAVAAQMFFKY
ncbi:MAG: YdcF family protein [Oscillospiraceae bacterium]|nr:YdcF family protein [Oscillospiraceae bacterium]